MMLMLIHTKNNTAAFYVEGWTKQLQEVLQKSRIAQTEKS